MWNFIIPAQAIMGGVVAFRSVEVNEDWYQMRVHFGMNNGYWSGAKSTIRREVPFVAGDTYYIQGEQEHSYMCMCMSRTPNKKYGSLNGLI